MATTAEHGGAWCETCHKIGWTTNRRAIHGALVFSAEHGKSYHVYRRTERCPLYHLTTGRHRGRGRHQAHA